MNECSQSQQGFSLKFGGKGKALANDTPVAPPIPVQEFGRGVIQGKESSFKMFKSGDTTDPFSSSFKPPYPGGEKQRLTVTICEECIQKLKTVEQRLSALEAKVIEIEATLLECDEEDDFIKEEEDLSSDELGNGKGNQSPPPIDNDHMAYCDDPANCPYIRWAFQKQNAGAPPSLQEESSAELSSTEELPPLILPPANIDTKWITAKDFLEQNTDSKMEMDK